jgi:hypothetical protein
MNQYVVNGAAYDYDANFNLATAPNWVGGFDAQNRLMSAAHGWDNAFFTYDGLGRCVRRIVYAPTAAPTPCCIPTTDGNRWKSGMGREISGPGTFTGQEPTRFCGVTTPAGFIVLSS